MLKISSKNTFILKEVAQPYRSDQILHMQLQQEALSTTCLGLPKNLKDADLSDPAFMHALASARIVDSTKSVVFTGDPDYPGLQRHSLHSIRAIGRSSSTQGAHAQARPWQRSELQR